LLSGCPKLDEKAAYVQKFTSIFAHNHIKSIAIVVMEVPCCEGMPMIVEKALKASGKRVPVETIVVGIEGGIVSRTPSAA
jgi:hypothetical protein